MTIRKKPIPRSQLEAALAIQMKEFAEAENDLQAATAVYEQTLIVLATESNDAKSTYHKAVGEGNSRKSEALGAIKILNQFLGGDDRGLRENPTDEGGSEIPRDGIDESD